MARRASHSGGRRARRRRAERRRFWLVIMPGLVVAVVLTVIVGQLVRSAADDGGATGSGGGKGGNAAHAPKRDTLLLTHRAADGRSDLIVLVGTDGGGSSVLLIPVATQVEVPSLGVQTLADMLREGDVSLLRTTVENLLGVRVARTMVLDDAGLKAALAPASPVPVELRGAVRFSADGDPAFPAGSQRLSAADAVKLLATAQPGSELDRLVTVQAVLQGWGAQLRKKRVAAATVAVQRDLVTLVTANRARDPHIGSLPVESVTTGGGERFEVRRDDLARYVKAAFPRMLLGPAGKRARVEILNGTGAVGVAQAVAAKIVPAGGEVTLSGNVPGFGVAKTQVIYYRDADQVTARRFLGALGCGVLKRARRAIGVTDVTIMVGADCPMTGTPAAT